MAESKQSALAKIAAMKSPLIDSDPCWAGMSPGKVWVSDPYAMNSMVLGSNQPGRAIAGDQYYLAVTKVVNGYVLQCGDETWVAKDEDELKNLFITAIVTKKMA